MIRKFPKLLISLSVVVITVGASAAIVRTRASRPVQSTAPSQAQLADPAFRDGFYLGKLDAESGRTEHPSVGRWNSPKDRASFLAGYQQSYRDVQASVRATPIP